MFYLITEPPLNLYVAPDAGRQWFMLSVLAKVCPTLRAPGVRSGDRYTNSELGEDIWIVKVGESEGKIHLVLGVETSVAKEQVFPAPPSPGIVRLIPTDPIEVALVVDLGNTRASAMVIDDIRSNDIERHLHRRIRSLRLRRWGWDDNSIEDHGVFDSFGIFCTGVSGAPTGYPVRRWSNVRLGSEAVYAWNSWQRQQNVHDGRFWWASPKRIFWDEDRPRRPWYAWKDSKKPLVALEEAGGIIEALRQRPKAEPNFFPPSCIVGLVFAELIEQAELQMNTPAAYEWAGFPGRRIVGHVEVLCPSGWSRSQRDLYRDRIQRGVDAYAEAMKRPKSPDVFVRCDEASAVMLAFVSGQGQRAEGRLSDWIRVEGRVRQTAGRPTPSVRIAVIDIGGGTSDLAIVDGTLYDAASSSELVVRRVFLEGRHLAGEDFIKRALEKYVLRCVIERLYDGRDQQRAFIERLEQDKRVWLLVTREFLWPFAIWLTDACNPNRKFDRSPAAVFNLVQQFAGILGDFDLPRFTQSADEKARRLSLLSEDSNVRSEMKRIAADMFGDLARYFAAAICAFDVDLVLICGKASELWPIREEFIRRIPLPSDQILHVSKDLWPEILAFDARPIEIDSKTATVFGGCLEALSSINQHLLGEDMKIRIEDAPALCESSQVWGLIRRAGSRFTLVSRLPEDVHAGGELICHLPSFLGRSRPGLESQSAELVYELRPKSNHTAALPKAVAVSLVRRQEADGGVRFDIAKVCVPSGEPLPSDSIEIRHRMIMEPHWLDEAGGIRLPNLR